MKGKMFGIVFLLGLMLSACGGAGQGGSGDFEITAEDFSYTPDIINVDAGQQISITFTNNGSVPHTFNIANKDAELEHILEEEDAEHMEEELHEVVLLEFHEIEPGASVTETFTSPLEAGDYEIFCIMPGHYDFGMRATLRVNP